MEKSKVALITFALFLFAAPVHAYVGPGAGLSLIGALWALIAAIATALIFVVAWPVRRMLRLKREARTGTAPQQTRASSSPSSSNDEAARQATVTRLRTAADDEEDLDRLRTR